jgi:hypothetical protein
MSINKGQGQPKKPAGDDNIFLICYGFCFWPISNNGPLPKQYVHHLLLCELGCSAHAQFIPSPLIPPFHNAKLHKSSCSNSLQRNLPAAHARHAIKLQYSCSIPNIYTRPLGHKHKRPEGSDCRHEPTPANPTDAVSQCRSTSPQKWALPCQSKPLSKFRYKLGAFRYTVIFVKIGTVKATLYRTLKIKF